MFKGCKPSSIIARCADGRRSSEDAHSGEWGASFERFRAERNELSEHEAELAWKAQQEAMLQEEEVATRLGTGGGRASGGKIEGAASGTVRASPTAADVRAAQQADKNPFARSG
ncbi:hypothetical protein BE221DRAFT_204152 [Ostreococcus tauri]|uniref:Uncharacterized protein n=1 Tax=Ostreococcus tauri TaxID=70448 RepID=A0A1Y5IM58_OSTTA|nr:hypothetical protein BE221DRAFT_204152 [Ostreococcus tauri]